MSNKFKVGDKVRVRKDLQGGRIYNGMCYFDEDMEIYRGNIYEITDARDYDSRGGRYDLKGIGDWVFSDDMLELVEFTKDDLKEGDIVTLRNGERLMLRCGRFYDLNEYMENRLVWLKEINEDLTVNYNYNDDDIVKVERAVSYTTVYERQEQAKEMTLKEVCDALGYEVKIVKEDN